MSDWIEDNEHDPDTYDFEAKNDSPPELEAIHPAIITEPKAKEMDSDLKTTDDETIGKSTFEKNIEDLGNGRNCNEII